MHFIQPKPYMDRLRLRNHAIGKERRKNLSKIILEKNTPFPKPVEYEDIDKAFFDWVDKKLDITYDGKKLPTYKLFSNQKISEYSQTWSNLDDTGNIIMNFKTITRENNPQHGESQGGNYNVPGNRDYPMFCVPVLQENGEEAYDLYTMKQPLSVNFMYTVSVICNKYEILNSFNQAIQYEFSALEAYIAPNDHYMPMMIENINDESEYSIDDRKYYAQAYSIKVLAYIIRKEDFKVTKIPSRFSVRLLGTEKAHKYNKVKRDNNWFGELENTQTPSVNKNCNSVVEGTQLPKAFTLSAFENCENPLEINDCLPPKPHIRIEEEVPECCNPKEDPYAHKKIKLIAEFPYCEEHETKFTMDCTMDVDSLVIHNVHDYVVKINGIIEIFDDELTLKPGDVIEINISREDDFKDSSFTIVGTDPDTVIDTRIDYESELDAPAEEEDIYVNKKGTE